MQPDFDRAYEENFSRVYGFLAYRVSSRADAEDLTQITFERAAKAWRSFDPRRARLETWLMSIARNALIDHGRRLQARPRETQEQDLEGLDHATEDSPNLGVSPDLANALATLQERERVVIALRFGGDLRGPEIAEVLGISLANAQKILSRSLLKLKKALELPREDTEN